MVQIKTFRFNILSNCTDYNMHMKKQNAHDEYESLYTPDKIDKEINYFCKDKDVIDIKVNEIYRSITESSGTNKVMLKYTIIYNEENAEWN